jgi:nitroreductase
MYRWKGTKTMSVFDVVQSVLAVRSYRDEPVPEGTIAKIVQAAHGTGSSMNGQPWHFIVVRDRATLEQIGARAQYGRYIAHAPLAVAVVLEDSRYAVSDASRAIQNMIVTAWEDGVGSNWVGFGGMDAIKPLLGIPQDLELFAIIPFGYPTEDIGKGKKKRKPLNEVVHRERFGEPWESGG